jgi:hypothetical protein
MQLRCAPLPRRQAEAPRERVSESALIGESDHQRHVDQRSSRIA